MYYIVLTKNNIAQHIIHSTFSCLVLHLDVSSMNHVFESIA